MYSDILKSLVSQTLIRQALTSIGGALVTDGILSASQVQDGIGAIFVLGSIVWSLYNAKHHAVATAQATGELVK